MHRKLINNAQQCTKNSAEKAIDIIQKTKNNAQKARNNAQKCYKINTENLQIIPKNTQKSTQ